MSWTDDDSIKCDRCDLVFAAAGIDRNATVIVAAHAGWDIDGGEFGCPDHPIPDPLEEAEAKLQKLYEAVHLNCDRYRNMDLEEITLRLSDLASHYERIDRRPPPSPSESPERVMAYAEWACAGRTADAIRAVLMCLGKVRCIIDGDNAAETDTLAARERKPGRPRK